MQDGIDSRRATRFPRARLLPVATLLSGVLLVGCGGSSGSSTATAAGGANASAPTVAAGRGLTSTGSGTATGGASSSLPAAPADPNAAALAFSRCMRANGVSNFPDPNPGGGFVINPYGLDRSSPAFQAAQAKCQRLLPIGPARPGTQTHPSAQTLEKLLKIATCMRQHGVPQFPDPRTSVPSNPFPSGAGVITDYDNAILLFPSTLDRHSPAYLRAVAACGTLAGKLGNGPHS
jgi:hypothetical protein